MTDETPVDPAKEEALGRLLARAQQASEDPLRFAKMMMDHEVSLTGAQLLVHALVRRSGIGVPVVVPRTELDAIDGRVESLEVKSDAAGNITAIVRPRNRAERRKRR